MSTHRQWLETFLRDHGGVAGTVHLRGAEALELHAAVNIPPKVQEITQRIPKGKGMAGLAWERDEPVTTCNLKNDGSGDVRPGAKAVDAAAAVALPVHDADGELRGVVGIAYASERSLNEEEIAQLRGVAQGLPK